MVSGLIVGAGCLGIVGDAFGGGFVEATRSIVEAEGLVGCGLFVESGVAWFSEVAN